MKQVTTETVVIKTSSENKGTEQVEMIKSVNKTIDLVREEMTDVDNVQTVEANNGEFIVEEIIGRKSNISGDP